MRSVIVGLLLLVLIGCGTDQNLADLQARSSSAADALEKTLGTKPDVCGHTDNGKLKSVTVTFDAAKVPSLNLAELETKVHAVVTAKFGRKPESLILVVSRSES